MRRILAAMGVVLAGAAMAGAAMAAGPYDGTYDGPWHVTTAGNTGACSRAEQAHMRITVADGRFTIPWAGQRVAGSVAPDGTVSGQQMLQVGASGGMPLNVSIRGHVAGNVLQADAGTSSCAVHMTMTKS
jgi:hypothetical protein